MAGLFGIGRRATLSNDARLQVREGRRSGRTKAARRGTPPSARPASRMEPLENRLLMSAVRPDSAFATTDFRRGDDLSTTTTGGLPLNFTLNFYGADYTSLYINNNGNVSFGSRNSTLVDAPFNSIPAAMIAPFYADVDTRGTVGQSVRWGRGTVDGHLAFGINWINVNFHDALLPHTNGTNSFQLVLIDRSDLGYGSFDIEFNYDRILWESGMKENGGSADGLGGSTARIGFSAGTGMDGQWFEMLGSGIAGSFLDSNVLSGLVHGSYNSDVAGRYVFSFRDGQWTDAPDTGGGANTAPMMTLSETFEMTEGANGSTDLSVTGIFDDPDADLWNVTADYGDGSGLHTLSYDESKMFRLEHTYANSGVYFVTVAVDDGNGGVATRVMRLDIVDRSAPVLEVSSAPASVTEGQWVTLTASTANDPDANDFHTFEWVAEGLDGAVSDDGRSFTFMACDSGTYSVRTIARDGSGNETTVDTSVVVANVAPTASGLAGPVVLNEGGMALFSLNGADDVSAADRAAGLVYSFDLDGDGVYEVSGASNAAGRVFDDNGTYTVRARVSDKDGGYSDYEMAVEVRNLAPTAGGMSRGGSSNEGGEVTLTIAGASDASSADLAAGLTYSFDFDGDGLYEVSGASRSASHVFDDNGSYVVRGRVSDKDGGSATFETWVVVNNVAPSALGLAVDGELKEGSPVTVSVNGASDPSGADLAAGLTYSFDFNGDGVWDVVGTSPSVTHVYDDNGRYTVRARVSDKDVGARDYSTELHIKNVPPRGGQMTDNNPVAEGSAVTVRLEGASDPSAADTAAGFTYSYDFNNDGAFDLTTTSPTATFAFPNEGVYTVRGRVADKDGDFTDYTTEVEVYNVAPTVGSFTTNATTVGSAAAGSTVTVSGSFSDAGVLDGHTAVVDWGDGTTSVATISESGGRGTLSASHVYASGGVFNVSLRLMDDASPAGQATAASQAVVTGVGLHNGVLYVVGTAARDTVKLIGAGSALKVQASFMGSHVDFNKSAVSEVRVLLGQNGDKFDTNGNVDRPIYLDGSLYTEGKADGITATTLNTKSLKLFSDTKVAA